MRKKLPESVKSLVDFITNQQAIAIMRLGVRSIVEGISISDRDSVICAIYIDVCTDAVWMKDLSTSDIQDLVCCFFVDDFSKSKNKPALPLTLRHCTMAYHLRIAQDNNWRRVVKLTIDSLKGGELAPTLSDIIEDRSINWDMNSLIQAANNTMSPNSNRDHAPPKHKLNCPYCGTPIQINQVFSRTEVTCYSCDKSFNVQP